MGGFRSMKARELKRVLMREPLGYRVTRQTGSHCRMEAEVRPPLTVAFHDGDTIPPGLVRKVLVRDIGMTDDEALGLL
jgi:predicted RNA binding protein YcfA (HicA-like mRNA interferase family)